MESVFVNSKFETKCFGFFWPDRDVKSMDKYWNGDWWTSEEETGGDGNVEDPCGRGGGFAKGKHPGGVFLFKTVLGKRQLDVCTSSLCLLVGFGSFTSKLANVIRASGRNMLSANSL